MGGADRENLTLKFVKALEHQFKEKISLVLGPAFSHHDELNESLKENINIKVLNNLTANEMIKEIKSHDC